jgi:hypothetical protein
MALLVAAGLVSGAANATFIDQGGGVILDTVTNLEWEQNANHGPFDLAGAVNYGNTLALDGGGWHLASTAELVGLYDNLIAAGACTLDCRGSIGGFTDIQRDYWSEFVPGVGRVVGFDFGAQCLNCDGQFSAWAVRPGDVGAAAPEPASLLLIGAGMLGLGWARQRGVR